MKMLPQLLSCACFQPLEPVVHLRRRFFLCPPYHSDGKNTAMKKKERSKICKSGFNPDRACYLTADGKYYCYEFENLQTGQKITQKFEVGKDLSLKLTVMLDETDHDSDLRKHYEGELRDPLFTAKFNSYKADPKDEDAVDHCDTISAQDSNLEDAIFSTPESENPLATKIYASIESDNIGYADRKD